MGEPIIPASAGIDYFTKERHYTLQIFLNATKPPAAVVTMTQYKGSVTGREPSTFQNSIMVPGQFFLGPTIIYSKGNCIPVFVKISFCAIFGLSRS